ncbi:hypothetical protein [Bacteroides sp. MSB163]|uniref:hypothetical protein n=1 Tax=Bacteroides maternus TaxID=3117552 RepID=UPI002EDB01B0
MKSDLPEITLLVVDKNKQCNHPQHYLFQITTLLVPDHNIACFQQKAVNYFFLQAFSSLQTLCASAFRLKDA